MNLFKKTLLFNTANIFGFVLIGLFVIAIVIIARNMFGGKIELASGWKVYSGNDYSISYPKELNAPKDTHLSSYVVFETNDFKIDETNGNIVSGYIVTIEKNIGFNYDNLDSCNKNPDNWIYESGNSLLGYGNSMIVDCANGKVTKERLTINGMLAVKYRFISTSGRNNGTGIIVNGQGKSYVIMIGYKDSQNQYLFDRMLSSFKLKE